MPTSMDSRKWSDSNRYADRVVFIVCFFLTLALVIQTAYQYGYDSKECKPIKTEIPLKNMTHKEAVRNIQWQFKDKGAVR